MKKKHLRFRSLLAMLLSVLLLVQLLPIQAFAVTGDESAGESEVTAEEEVYDSEATILGEIVSERDEYVKRFRMSDGTIQVVQYDVPVHYLDDGQWIEYDKSLSEDDALEEDTELEEVIEETENTEVSDVPEEDATAEEPAVEILETIPTMVLCYAVIMSPPERLRTFNFILPAR